MRPQRGAARAHPRRVPHSDSAPSPQSAANRVAIALVLTAFTVAFLALQAGSAPLRSATFDEPIHLTSGYAALAEGDYRVEGTHPPFIRMWAALPLLFMRDVRLDTSVIDQMAPKTWVSNSTAFQYSTDFLHKDNDASRLLGAARFMNAIWGVVLGILVFSWTYEWLGLKPAIGALLFYTLEPNLMAHASLVTTDVGITCFMFGTIYFLWRTCRSVSAPNVAGLTIFFSLAIVTKFSALALGPLVFCLLVVAVRMRPQFEARTAAAIVVLLAVASYVAIWAISGFRYLPSDNPAWSLHLEDLPLASTVPELARVTRWIDDHRLLPNMISEGFLVFAQSMLPPNYTFLAGEYSPEGWWYYFPVAFLLKSPIPFIALLAIGLFVCLRQRQRLGSLNEAFLLLPVAIYLVAAINNTFQVGLRHILPLYPYFMMLAAAAAMMLSRKPVGRVVLGGLTIAWAVSLISVYPYTLTYFNRFAGGSGNGYKYLADSNIDWGQGLKQLKEWMDEQNVPTIALAYFGTADPDYYGIAHTRLPAATPGYEPSSVTSRGQWTKPALPGYVAVGATVLTGVYHDPHWMLFYEGLRKMPPTAVIGNSVFVYRLERWPVPAVPDHSATAAAIDAERRLGDELMKVEWFSRAIVHYRRYLEHRANEPAVLTSLGYALMMTDQPQDAATVLRRAIALSPDSGLAHMVLSTALLNARGNVSEIVEHARQAARVLPADPTALLTLGRALAINGQFREAEAALSRVLTIAPQEAAAHELLQRIRARSRQIG